MPRDKFHKLPQEKKDRIQQAALDEFVAYRQDYSRASVKRIAQRAGIAIGSIYDYFTDKNDIFTWLLEVYRPEIPFRPEQHTLPERIDRPLISYTQEGDAFHSLVDVLERNFPLLYSCLFVEESLPIYRNLQGFLEKDQERGLLREGVDVHKALYLLLLLDFVSYHYYEKNRDEDLLEIVRAYQDMFFYGVYRPQEPEQPQ